MTPCPRCGQPLQAPVAACPRCGQQFAPPAQPYQTNGYDGSAPAWTRQAHQPAPGAGIYSQQAAPRHQPPGNGQPGARPGFSMNELVSEEALPDWLRQASAESAQPTQRQPVPGAPPYGAQQQQAYPPAYPPTQQPAAPGYGSAGYGGAYGGGYAPNPAEESAYARPDASAFPSIESAGSYQAPLVGGGGMSAGSLLDPNALPAWLTGHQGQAAAEGMRGGEGMRAQSLVDDAALPGWLRNEAASPAQVPASAPPPAVPGWGGYAAPGAPASPFAPNGPVGPAGYAGMQPPMQAPMNPMNPMNGQQGIPASQLVDPNALPGWMQAQGQAQGGGAGMPQPAASAQGKWSASDLIDPSMLPGWVRSNDVASPQANAARPGIPGQGMPGQDIEAPRERTGRVPAPRAAHPNAERDFGASRAGMAQRGPISRKQQAARPLGNGEKPAWLREDEPGGNGQPGAPAYPSGRPGQSRNGQSRNGYDDPGSYSNANGQRGQSGQRGQRGQRGQYGQMPPGQPGPAGQSWAAPDGYESSPWSRPRPTRHDAKTVAKKRKGGFFGFLRRG